MQIWLNASKDGQAAENVIHVKSSFRALFPLGTGLETF